MSKRIVQSCEREELNWEELSPGEQQLLHAARKTAEQAYAPYSSFLVGAALELENGVLLTGNNQENAAYPSGLCAERVALFFAGANYPKTAPVALGIYAAHTGKPAPASPATPCGACLQSLWEYEKRFGKDLTILLMGREVIWKFVGIKQLLPYAFESI